MSEFFNTYLEYVDRTEPPILFHRWSAIVAAGALLGRRVWLPFGPFRIFPNMYCMLIGDPGTRKSTAIKLARKLASATGYNTFAAERTTKEKFLLDLEGAPDGNDTNQVVGSAFMEEFLGGSAIHTDPKEVFVVADEFNDFLGSGGLEFLSLLGTLWDWDDEDNPFKQRLKNSKSIAIYQPTINLLAGNTHQGLALAFPPESIGQGFMSRLILVFAESSGVKITFPEVPPETVKQKLIHCIHETQKLNGPISVSEKAKGMLDVIYRQDSKVAATDARFVSYSTRRFTHLLKLCLIVAVTDLQRQISARHVLLANTILSYTEHFMPKALGEFGKARNSDVNNKVVTFLAGQLKPVDFIAIWKHVRTDFEKQEDLTKALMSLQTAGIVQWVSTPSTKGWLPVRKVLGNNEVYVDYDLLKEYKRVRI